MSDRSKLLRMEIYNLGCIGPEGVHIWLDNIVCLVGRNNVGKSTVLRAYELALGAGMNPEDRCKWAPEDDTVRVVLDVHIPAGIDNVNEKWKIEKEGFLVVRSKWTWGSDMKSERQTWDPSLNDGNGDWSEDDKASGADNVFKSRLPRPIRINSLQDPGKIDDTFMAFIIEPLITQIKQDESDPESFINQAIKNLVESVQSPIENYRTQVRNIADEVKKSMADVFPELNVSMDIKIDTSKFDILGPLIKSGSGVHIIEGTSETKLSQQGAGAKRALFWTLLRVHNILKRKSEEEKKRLNELEKAKQSKNKIEQKQKKSPMDEKKLEELNETIKQMSKQIDQPFGSSEQVDTLSQMSFPGYILLIDEPENALHPIASRSAQVALYELAEDPDWQVMVTTHSPYFINPLSDHTTIVRLEREANSESITPRTYRTEKVSFSEDDRDRLQALQKMDTGLSEIFFGSYPILVEGDTEYASFIAAVLEDNPALSEKVIVVKARGKATLVPLIKILHHFRVNFGILHDCDSPYVKSGTNNAMWTINVQIFKELVECRQSEMKVRHRVSIPDFERRLGGEELGKDKPFAAYSRMKRDLKMREEIRSLLTELMESEQYQPFKEEDILKAGGYEAILKEKVLEWANGCGLSDDPRYFKSEQ